MHTNKAIWKSLWLKINNRRVLNNFIDGTTELVPIIYISYLLQVFPVVMLNMVNTEATGTWRLSSRRTPICTWNALTNTCCLQLTITTIKPTELVSVNFSRSYLMTRGRRPSILSSMSLWEVWIPFLCFFQGIRLQCLDCIPVRG